MQQGGKNQKYYRMYGNGLKRKKTKEEINNAFLLATDNKEMAALHVAAMWGTPEILQEYRYCIERK